MTELTITRAQINERTGDCTHIRATGPSGQIILGFRRTSKVPNDGSTYRTTDLGPSTLYKVEEFRGLPRSILRAGGWFVAMRDNEAMFIDFESSQKYRVTVGSDDSKKAHCLVDGHYNLYGLPDSVVPGVARQFVAAPASSRYQDDEGDDDVVEGLSIAIRAPKAVLHSFEIYIKTLTGKVFPVQVNDATTGLRLKAMIEIIMGIPIDQQRLKFDGEQLQDGTVLSSYSVEEGSTILMTLRLRGGGVGNFFNSHTMVLSPGGLVQQPKSREDSSQTIWANPPTFVRIHILNAEHVRKWTGIDPPQSLVDPELYTLVGLPFPSDEECEELARKEETSFRQLYNVTYESDRSTMIKEDNPYEAIQSRNSRGLLLEDRDQNSGKKSSWWRRFFK